MAKDSDPFDELVHRVNNLLGVISTQAMAARAAGTSEAQKRALELIEASAKATGEVVARVRREHRG